jgi:transposase InsO family protein
LAFGNKETTIKRLRDGASNKSDISGVLQTNNIHLATCARGNFAVTLNAKCLTSPLALHADNGSPMKGATIKVKMERLGVTESFSRPRVSNDNPFSEALFRTCKYLPNWPTAASRPSTRRGLGFKVSCAGITSSTSTARFASSRPISATIARTGLCSPSATASMKLPVRPTPNGGQAIPAKGNPLTRSG